jgi:NADH-quinone oxidoreductase subunit M
MYKRIFFGPISNEYVAQFQDITWTEKINYILLAAGVFFVGLYPQPIIHVLRVTIAHLLLQSMPPELVMNLSKEILF